MCRNQKIWGSSNAPLLYILVIIKQTEWRENKISNTGRTEKLWNRIQRLELLQELLGDCTEDIFIRPPFHCDYGFNIHVGKNFFANYQCIMLDAAPIHIGDNCLMGPQTCLYTVNHPMDAATRVANYVYGEPITIGDNVWFGGNCVVLSGVTIGNNAVIGAGSIVTSDIPDNAVAAGNPARILRYIDNTPTANKPAP